MKDYGVKTAGAGPGAVGAGGERLIVARLPLEGVGDAEVAAGDGVVVSEAGGVRAWLYGMPYFHEGWVCAENLAGRWVEDRERVLEAIDGMFLLLVTEPGGFYLVNDKVSPLTWHWRREGGVVHASNSLKGLVGGSEVGQVFDVGAWRHHVYTRGHHFDMSVVSGVSKVLKGHWVGRGLVQERYYDLSSRIEWGAGPEDYFEHVKGFVGGALAGKKVAVLASNGYDSRLNCLLLSQCLDRFDVFTIRSDWLSEHRLARRFLGALPNQNFRVREFGHSMARSSCWYTPRRLATATGTYLGCFDDLAENKEHLLFAEVFDVLAREGYDVVVNGASGDSVRRVIPLVFAWDRDEGLDQAAGERMRGLFGIDQAGLKARHIDAGSDAAVADALRERMGTGQVNYTPGLLLNHGVGAVGLPICTSRALELYRGIDRTKLCGRGGINFFKEHLEREVPGAEPVPFNVGIALNMPLEDRGWLERTVDVGLAHRAMLGSGMFDEGFLEMMRETYGRQRDGFRGSFSYLNLWGWYSAVFGSEEEFVGSLEPLRRSDPYLHGGVVGRGLGVAGGRVRDWLRLFLVRVCWLAKPNHPLQVWFRRRRRGLGAFVGRVVSGIGRRLRR